MPTPRKKPVFLFFQEAKPGDIRKLRAQSNDADTGGGARDLRIRPAREFTPLLSPMFPDTTDNDGVSSGVVHSIDATGHEVTKRIEFWRPTEARPGEARIGRIYEIEGWASGVNEQVYEQDLAQGNKTFLLLVRDAAGTVWARPLREADLDGERQQIRDYIRQRINATKEERTVRGTIDFQTGRTYP